MKEMARGKVQIKRIENKTSRQVTFCKRKSGLMKKAYELSVLCEAEIALVIFSTRGRLHEYASFNIRSTIDKYKKTCSADTLSLSATEINIQQYQTESQRLHKEIQTMQNTNRHLMGDVNNLSARELKTLENRLEKGLARIRAKKHEVLQAEILHMQQKNVDLQNENALLSNRIAEEENKFQPVNLIGQLSAFQPFQNFASRNNLLQPMTMLDHPGPSYPLPELKNLYLG